MRKIIDGDVSLRKLHLTELFDLSDVKVVGDFDCSYNTLTSLRGSPHTVGSNYYCHDNILTSLKGGPHTVDRVFDCSNNKLTNLIGAPKTVHLSFVCDGNDLTSLEGITTFIGGGFYIDKKLKDKFPEKYIRSLCTIKGRVRYI